MPPKWPLKDKVLYVLVIVSVYAIVGAMVIAAALAPAPA